MEKFRVWVDLKDKRYAKRLTEFLMHRYSEMMQVSILYDTNYKTDLDSILLTDKESQREGYGNVIWVSDHEGLNPYQSGHKIAREILKQKEDWHLNEEILSFGKRKGEWISVYSPIGGIGKSTLAMGIADVLARKRKVLFITLEGPSAWKLFFQYPLNYNLSDFFYCFLMGNPQEWDQQIKEMICRQKSGVYFLAPCQYPDDLLELRDIELLGWMNLLKENFDYIVADLGCQTIRPYQVILKNSSKQCFLLDQRTEGKSKWQNFEMTYEEMRDQVFFCRYEDKSKQGEICLPEDSEIFEFQDGIKQFSRKSIYYTCLEKAVEGWI